METLSLNTLGEIALCLSLLSLSGLSATSYDINTSVTALMNVYTRDGRMWWERKLKNDYPKEVKPPFLLPNEIYVSLAMPFMTALRFSIELQRHDMRYCIALGASVGFGVSLNMTDKTILLSFEDFMYLLENKQYDIIWKGHLTVISATCKMLEIKREKTHLLEEMIDQYEVPRYGITALLNIVSMTLYSNDDPQLLQITTKLAAKLEGGSRDYVGGALRMLACNSNRKVLRAVLDAFPVDSDGRRSGIDVDLIHAITNVSLRESILIEVLLEYGANPNDTDGRKPLNEAVRAKNVNAIKLLVSSPYFYHACVDTRLITAKLKDPEKELIRGLAKEGKINIVRGKKGCPLEIPS